MNSTWHATVGLTAGGSGHETVNEVRGRFGEGRVRDGAHVDEREMAHPQPEISFARGPVHAPVPESDPVQQHRRGAGVADREDEGVLLPPEG